MMIAVALLALMDTTGKYITADFPVSQILWVRYGVFLILACLLARPRGIIKSLSSRQPGLQIGRSLLLVVEVAVFLFSFKNLPLVTVHSVGASSPLIATALAIPLLGEKVGIRRWLAVIIGFAGVLLIIRPGHNEFGGAVYLPLLGALLWALYQILVRRVVRDGPETTSLYTALVGFAAFGMIAPFEWQAPDLKGGILLLAVGVFGGSGHILLIKSLQLAPASVLQPLNYMILVWAAILGFVVFGYIPDVWTIAGALIVVASGLYAISRQQRERTMI